jgi:hypothetical protein
MTTRHHPRPIRVLSSLPLALVAGEPPAPHARGPTSTVAHTTVGLRRERLGRMGLPETSPFGLRSLREVSPQALQRYTGETPRQCGQCRYAAYGSVLSPELLAAVGRTYIATTCRLASVYGGRAALMMGVFCWKSPGPGPRSRHDVGRSFYCQLEDSPLTIVNGVSLGTSPRNRAQA